MNIHEIEEAEFGRDGGLWDADPEVCCRFFQLGACSHTEGYYPEADEPAVDSADLWGGDLISDEAMADLIGGEDEPF